MNTMDNAEAYDLLDRASSEVSALADRMEPSDRHFEARPFNPWREKIPALVDSACLDDEMSEMLVGSNRDTPLCRGETIAAIWSARDHLYAISSCLTSRSAFSQMSLSRIVMEAACVGTWLNADGEEPSEMLCRCIWLIRDHLGQQVNLNKALSEVANGWAQDNRESLRAERTDCQNLKNRLGKASARLCPTDAQRPKQQWSKSKIVRDMMTYIAEDVNDDPTPGIFYKLYSGAVHSDPNTMLGMLDRSIPESEHGLKTISVGRRLDPVIWAVGATTTMLKTVNHQWDTQIDVNGIDAHIQELWRIAHHPQQ